MSEKKGTAAVLRSEAAEIDALERLRASKQQHWKRFFGTGIGAFFALLILSQVAMAQVGKSVPLALLPMGALVYIFGGGLFKLVRSSFTIHDFRVEMFRRLGVGLVDKAFPGLERDPGQDVLKQSCAFVPFAGFSPTAVLKGSAGGREVVFAPGEVQAGRHQATAHPATLLQWRLAEPWPDDFLCVPVKGKGEGLLGLLDDVGIRTAGELRQDRKDLLVGRREVTTGHDRFDQVFRSKAASVQAAVPSKALLNALLALSDKVDGRFAFSLRGEWASLLYRGQALFWAEAVWFNAPLGAETMAAVWDEHVEVAEALAGLSKHLP